MFSTSIRRVAKRAVALPCAALVVLLVLASGCSGSSEDADGSCTNPRYALRYYSDARARAGAIAIFDANGKSTRPGGDWITGEPSFSPNGRSLAVAWFDSSDEGRDTAIAILGTHPSSRRIVPGTEHGEYPAWSPDGSTIAYANNDYRAGGGELKLMDAASGARNRVIVSRNKIVREGERTPSMLSPAWSPNGRQLAFLVTDFFGLPTAWIVNRDGSNLHRLRDFSEDADLVSWRPDGNALLASGPSGDAVILDVASGKKTVVDGPAPAAIWSGGGNNVLYFASRGSGRDFALTRGTIDGTRLRPGDKVPDLPVQDVFPQGEGLAVGCTR